MRLRRVAPGSPGWTRRRAGRGFVLLDETGARITDPEVRERVRALAIPPAWRDVWICPWPHGHLQATGLDDAGRRQYLYHPAWSERRARRKHEHVLGVARRLPAARGRVTRDLALPGMPRDRALALAFRLLDVAYFRVGGEAYARGNGSYGLATVRREHVAVRGDRATFVYAAKSGQVREVEVIDDAVARAVRSLLRREDDHPDLLAYRDGARWRDVTSADIAAYLKDRLGPEATPKDFRTWHGTVLAATALARVPVPPSPRARAAAVTAVVREVAEQLGNTPAVCRASYVDPRVVDLWERGALGEPGRTRSAAERAVLEALG